MKEIEENLYTILDFIQYTNDFLQGLIIILISVVYIIIDSNYNNNSQFSLAFRLIRFYAFLDYSNDYPSRPWPRAIVSSGVDGQPAGAMANKAASANRTRWWCPTTAARRGSSIRPRHRRNRPDCCPYCYCPLRRRRQWASTPPPSIPQLPPSLSSFLGPFLITRVCKRNAASMQINCHFRADEFFLKRAQLFTFTKLISFYLNELFFN